MKVSATPVCPETKVIEARAATAPAGRPLGWQIPSSSLPLGIRISKALFRREEE